MNKPDFRVKCPYCGAKAALVTGMVIYPHRQDLADKKFYQCAPCGAYVGCHPPAVNGRGGLGIGTTPLGRLANAELRKLKTEAHAAFDPMWKGGGMHRREAYGWLAKQLGIAANDAHIGMFDEVQCRRVVVIVKDWKGETV